MFRMAIYARSHINRVTEAIIGSAIDVHRQLGPGLFESAYQSCMAYELKQRGISFRSAVTLPLTYKGMEIDAAYEIDLWVEDLVVVELKCVRELAPVHEIQTLTYVREAHRCADWTVDKFLRAATEGRHQANHQPPA